MNIELYLTPVPFDKSKAENKTVVVIDVLRATTSICAALSSGARAVIPTNGRGEAVDMWDKIGPDNTVLAGEEKGLIIENFHLGNSPFEFTEKNVKDKFVIMSTTNGTPAFSKALNTGHVICGAVVNISTVVERIIAENSDLAIVCSGRDGHFSNEDTITGGLLINLLKEKKESEIKLNDAADLAFLLYNNNKDNLKGSIAAGEHARYLKEIGFENDVDFASAKDTLPVLPVLKDGKLILENN